LKAVNHLLIAIIAFYWAGCTPSMPADVEQIVQATPNKKELIKLIDRYQRPEDSLKLKAVWYLIRNMDDQFHLEGPAVDKYRRLYNKMDSLQRQGGANAFYKWDSLIKATEPIVIDQPIRVKDIDIISGQLLADNIDSAFRAWNYPWARRLSFDEFCQYILPYKLKNELPENWRGNMMQRYAWVLKQVKDSNDVVEAADLINNDVRKWFYISNRFSCAADPNCSDLLKTRVGQCSEATQLVAYAMRAMGIPASLDYTPFWANKGGRHDWNSLLCPLGEVIFMGTESNPGFEKIEDPGYNGRGPTGMKRKRAKIYRYSFQKVADTINTRHSADIPDYFANHHRLDVTNRFVPVSTVTLQLDTAIPGQELAYLCVFNNKQWQPVQWGRTAQHKEVVFAAMGRDVAYLPMVYHKEEYWPAADPFILHKNGTVRTLHADVRQCYPIKIIKKYPEDPGNYIIPGFHYELYYWDKDWISLGKQLATTNYLIYDHVPANALLFIRNLDAGFQERIFTYENGQQIWW
jgi:hypothetical protein